MTHPAKPALRSLRQPYDTTKYHPPITQEFGNVASFEPSVFDYHDGIYGWIWESGATQNTTHTGKDFGLNSGTPLLAVADGTVRACSPPAASYGFGNLTILDVGGGLLVFYAHQSQFGCAPGQKLSAGQEMGYVGSTGNSSGPHLHFATGMDDLHGYYYFFSPDPYLLYAVPPAAQYPTAGKYKVLIAMYLRTEPKTDASHGAFVETGDILSAVGGPDSWTTSWRLVTTAAGAEGWAFAPNLQAA
jgi:murein DD-endopeptidase MepM/ murein hydrolase activator NlpD